MRALVTGGAGFIGFHLARRLAEHGVEVDLVDSFRRGVRDSGLDDLLSSDTVRLIEADLVEPVGGDMLSTDYELIFHFAAIIGVAMVEREPFRVLEDNVKMLSNVLDVARRQTRLRRLIFASTSEVYAGTLKHFRLPIPTPESTPIALTDLKHARTSYMLSKIYGEAMCRHSGVPFTIVRPHNIYGPRMGLSHVVPELLKRAWETPDGGELVVYSPDHRRTFCYVEDTVEIISLASREAACENVVLNLGMMQPEYSMRAVARMAVETVGRDLVVVDGPITPGSPVRRCPDTSRAEALLSRSAEIDLAEGMRRTYDWYRANVFEPGGITAR